MKIHLLGFHFVLILRLKVCFSLDFCIPCVSFDFRKLHFFISFNRLQNNKTAFFFIFCCLNCLTVLKYGIIGLHLKPDFSALQTNTSPVFCDMQLILLVTKLANFLYKQVSFTTEVTISSCISQHTWHCTCILWPMLQ